MLIGGAGGGLTDVDALRAGQDPNGAPGSNLVPAYGCSSAASAFNLLTLNVLGVWLYLLKRGSNLRSRRSAKRRGRSRERGRVAAKGRKINAECDQEILVRREGNMR